MPSHSFSAQTRERAREIIARYPAGRERSALLPLLHLVQSDQGYVSAEGIEFCADQLGLTKAQVGAVATFYTMYKRKPAGDWLVSVCTNTMCGVLGGNQAYEALSEHLGVGHNETTADGAITLEHAECLAACDYAPVMTVNYEFFDKVSAEDALTLVKKLQAGERPQPTRGSRLCTLKEISLQLAGGFGDYSPDEGGGGGIAEGNAGEPTLAGNRLADQYGISVAGFDPATPIARKDTPPAPESPGNVAPPTTPKPAVDEKPARDTHPGGVA
jgi:NADH-quinone oxidoreductase subunit E